MAIIVELHSRD